MSVRPFLRSEPSASRATPPARDERVLLDQIRAGDASAFEELFRATVAPLTGFVMRVVGSQEAARDVVQDVFVRVWMNRATLVVRDNLRAYLYAAAYRRALNAVRHHRVEEQSLGAFLMTGQSPAAGMLPKDAADQAERREVVAAVERAMALLPPRAREVALLRWVDGLARAEIAATLGISIKTVDAHLQVASRIVRDRLGHVWP